MTTEVQEVSANGSDLQLPEIATQLRSLIEQREEVLSQLDAERQEVLRGLDERRRTLQAEIKAYEKALLVLSGEPLRKRNRKAQLPYKRTIGDERLAEVEQMIRDFAKHTDEFRQVDVRAAYGTLSTGKALSSSITAQVFEILRQRNVLRIARVDGNSKYYRLTREALAEQS